MCIERNITMPTMANAVTRPFCAAAF